MTTLKVWAGAAVFVALHLLLCAYADQREVEADRTIHSPRIAT